MEKLGKLEHKTQYEKEWAITHAFQSIDSRDWDRTPLCVRTSSNFTIERTRQEFSRYLGEGSQLGAAQVPNNYLEKGVQEGQIFGAHEQIRLLPERKPSTLE